MRNVKVKCINDYTLPKSLTKGKIYYGLLLGKNINGTIFIEIAKDDIGQKNYSYVADRFEIVEGEEQTIEDKNWEFGLED